MTAEELVDQSMVPDTNTVGYWVERLRPLMDSATGSEEEVILVCANRTGQEGVCPRIGEVKYAGSSCVFSMKKGQDIKIWDILGRSQEGVLMIDTKAAAGFTISFREKPEPASTSQNGAAEK